MADFKYSQLFQLGKDDTQYKLVSTEGVSTVEIGDIEFLKVEPEALEALTSAAFYDVSHFLRRKHLESLSNILRDPEASENDKFVAAQLLKNATIAAQKVLPSCQDTGTAIIMGKKGEQVLTGFDDSEALSRGVYDIYNN